VVIRSSAFSVTCDIHSSVRLHWVYDRTDTVRRRRHRQLHGEQGAVHSVDIVTSSGFNLFSFCLFAQRSNSSNGGRPFQYALQLIVECYSNIFSSTLVWTTVIVCWPVQSSQIVDSDVLQKVLSGHKGTMRHKGGT